MGDKKAGDVNPRAVFAVLAAVTMMCFVDLSAVNVAIPVIRVDFQDASLSTLAWVLDIYAIIIAGFVLAAGRFADVIGIKRTACAGLVLFVFGSALCATATNADFLIASRGIQALGAAIFAPSGMALLMHVYEGNARYRAIAAYSAVAAASAGFGPLIGGALIDLFDWRSIFAVNIPIGLILLLIGLRILPEWKDSKALRPDMVGAFLFTAALTSLAAAILMGDSWGWGSVQTVALLAAGVGFLIAAILRQGHHSSPIVERAVLRAPLVRPSAAVMFLFSLSIFGFLFVGAVFLAAIWGYNALETGAALAPCPLLGALLAPLGVRVAERFGGHVSILIGGAAYAAGALFLAQNLGSDPAFTSTWLPGVILLGIGTGFVFPVVAASAVMAVPADRLGTGASLSFTSRQAGAVFGIAVGAALLDESTLALDLSSYQTVFYVYAAVSIATALAGFSLKGKLQLGREDEPPDPADRPTDPVVALPQTVESGS